MPTAGRVVTNRPVDLAIEAGRLVVGTSVPARSTPSNLHVFDIPQPDDPVWTGAASVSNGVLDGDLLRLVMRGSYVYALANRKGVQVVDVRRAEINFADTGGPTSPAYWAMIRALNTDGQGFGQDAIVATLPLGVERAGRLVPARPRRGRLRPGRPRPAPRLRRRGGAARRDVPAARREPPGRRVHPHRDPAHPATTRTCARCAWPWVGSPAATSPSSAWRSAGPATATTGWGLAVVDVDRPDEPAAPGPDAPRPARHHRPRARRRDGARGLRIRGHGPREPREPRSTLRGRSHREPVRVASRWGGTEAYYSTGGTFMNGARGRAPRRNADAATSSRCATSACGSRSCAIPSTGRSAAAATCSC